MGFIEKLKRTELTGNREERFRSFPLFRGASRYACRTRKQPKSRATPGALTWHKGGSDFTPNFQRLRSRLACHLQATYLPNGAPEAQQVPLWVCRVQAAAYEGWPLSREF